MTGNHIVVMNGSETGGLGMGFKISCILFNNRM